MKSGAIHFIVALLLFGYAIYISVVFNDICDTVMSCTAGLFHTILGVMFVILKKIDSHEDKITKKT